MAGQSSDLTRGQGSVAASGSNRVTSLTFCRLENLTVYYDTERGPVHAVEDVTFSLHAQERFGLAGESGSGKSSMALTIMRLIKPPARIVSGSIWLENIDLLAVPEAQMKAAATRPDRAGRPGLDELAEPGGARPRPDRRRPGGPRREAHEKRAGRAGDEPAGQGGPVAPGGEHVPARAQRRDEATRRDRHRHQPAPQGDHRRRADQRARRRRSAPGDGDAQEISRPRSAPRSSWWATTWA